MASAAVAHPLEACISRTVDLDDPSMILQLAVHSLTGMMIIPETSYSASAPVATVKAEVEAASGLPTRLQSLIWQGCILETNTLLGSLDLPTEGSVLQLVVTLPPEEQVEQAQLLMEEAAQALDTLHVRDIQELKQLAKPPGGVDLVVACVLHLLAGIDPTIGVDSKGRVKDVSWNASRKIMKEPNKFLADLRGFKMLIENGSVPERNIQAARKIIDEMGPEFSCAWMCKKSSAAAGICVWVVSIVRYHDVVSQILKDFEGFDIMSELREQTRQ